MVALLCNSFSSMCLDNEIAILLFAVSVFVSCFKMRITYVQMKRLSIDPVERGNLLVWLLSGELRSRATSGRTNLTPAGNLGLGFVADGNLMASRCALLLLLASAMELVWMLEQPSGSILPKYKRVNDLFALLWVPWW